MFYMNEEDFIKFLFECENVEERHYGIYFVNKSDKKYICSQTTVFLPEAINCWVINDTNN